MGKKAKGSPIPPPAKLVVAGTVEIPREPPFEKKKANFEQTHNMSGLLCLDAGHCLMVTDEKQGVHRLKVRGEGGNIAVEHEAVLTLKQPSAAFLRERNMVVEDLEELDLEAIARTGDDGPLAGHVILVGSHANARKTGKPNPGAHLIALAKRADLASKFDVPVEWASFDGLFEQMLPSALYQTLQRAGLNIEGATVFGDRLYLGLRSPTRRFDPPGAYVVSTPLGGLPGENFEGARLHVLPTGEPMIGIRSMETVGDIVLIVTGDTGVDSIVPDKSARPPERNINLENKKRPFLLRAWKPNDGDVLEKEIPARFPEKEGQKFESGETDRAKVEGIAVASRSGKRVSLLVVYDGNNEVFCLPDVKLP